MDHATKRLTCEGVHTQSEGTNDWANSMPPCLLEAVFLLVKQQYSRIVAGKADRLLPIPLVCKQWGHVFASLPDLWEHPRVTVRGPSLPAGSTPIEQQQLQQQADTNHGATIHPHAIPQCVVDMRVASEVLEGLQSKGNLINALSFTAEKITSSHPVYHVLQKCWPSLMHLTTLSINVSIPWRCGETATELLSPAFPINVLTSLPACLTTLGIHIDVPYNLSIGTTATCPAPLAGITEVLNRLPSLSSLSLQALYMHPRELENANLHGLTSLTLQMRIISISQHGYMPSMKELCLPSSLCGSIQQLVCTVRHHEFKMPHVLRQCSRLTALVIEGGNFVEHPLPEVMHCLTSLQSLDLDILDGRYCQELSALSVLTQLTKLRVHQSREHNKSLVMVATYSDLLSVLPSLQQLRELLIEGTCGRDIVVPDRTLSQLPQLTKLRIDTCDVWRFENPATPLSNSCREIDICVGAFDPSCACIFACTNLRKLELDTQSLDLKSDSEDDSEVDGVLSDLCNLAPSQRLISLTHLCLHCRVSSFPAVFFGAPVLQKMEVVCERLHDARSILSIAHSTPLLQCIRVIEMGYGFLKIDWDDCDEYRKLAGLVLEMAGELPRVRFPLLRSLWPPDVTLPGNAVILDACNMWHE